MVPKAADCEQRHLISRFALAAGQSRTGNLQKVCFSPALRSEGPREQLQNALVVVEIVWSEYTDCLILVEGSQLSSYRCCAHVALYTGW